MKEDVKGLQRFLNHYGATLEVDGILGPKTREAGKLFFDGGLPLPHTHDKGNVVIASSFADPADIRAFKKCKAAGGSDMYCFKSGDNGIGKWGDDTTAPEPMCALPPDDWKHLGAKARGAKVEVTCNGGTIITELRDTMPWKKNIKNGTGIDLNPEACKQLGLKPPIKIAATWRWATILL